MASPAPPKCGNHQDRKEIATDTNPKHDGTCTEFLTNLAKLYTTLKLQEGGFEWVWFEKHKGAGGYNSEGKRMRICVGPMIPFTKEDYKNGRNECDNVCEGEIISIDDKEGWVTIVGPDGDEYRLSATSVLSFE